MLRVTWLIFFILHIIVYFFLYIQPILNLVEHLSSLLFSCLTKGYIIVPQLLTHIYSNDDTQTIITTTSTTIITTMKNNVITSFREIAINHEVKFPRLKRNKFVSYIMHRGKTMDGNPTCGPPTKGYGLGTLNPKTRVLWMFHVLVVLMHGIHSNTYFSFVFCFLFFFSIGVLHHMLLASIVPPYRINDSVPYQYDLHEDAWVRSLIRPQCNSGSDPSCRHAPSGCDIRPTG